MQSLIRYKTKPEFADQNQQLVENVYAELNADDPGGVHYATFRLADGVTFLHLFTTDADDRADTLGKVAAFKEFLRQLPERCAEAPAAQDITVVGSYRMLERDPAPGDWSRLHRDRRPAEPARSGGRGLEGIT